jgi:hypothetical protein
VVAAVAKLQGSVARLRGRIPELELDAVRLLQSTGYQLLHPDFRTSMKEMGRLAALG